MFRYYSNQFDFGVGWKFKHLQHIDCHCRVVGFVYSQQYFHFLILLYNLKRGISSYGKQCLSLIANKVAPAKAAGFKKFCEALVISYNKDSYFDPLAMTGFTKCFH